MYFMIRITLQSLLQYNHNIIVYLNSSWEWILLQESFCIHYWNTAIFEMNIFHCFLRKWDILMLGFFLCLTGCPPVIISVCKTFVFGLYLKGRGPGLNSSQSQNELEIHFFLQLSEIAHLELETDV